MNEQQVRERLAAAITEAGSAVAWSQAHSLHPSFVSDVSNGRRPPSKRILDALGLEEVVTYRERPSASAE